MSLNPISSQSLTVLFIYVFCEMGKKEPVPKSHLVSEFDPFIYLCHVAVCVCLGFYVCDWILDFQVFVYLFTGTVVRVVWPTRLLFSPLFSPPG